MNTDSLVEKESTGALPDLRSVLDAMAVVLDLARPNAFNGRHAGAILHIQEWMREQERTLSMIIERAWSEILRDIASGVLPAGVKSFSELHDHVDANGYGGAFEGVHPVADMDFWNAVQDECDRRLKARIKARIKVRKDKHQ